MYNFHMQIIDKGWGFEKIIHNGDGYCGKILCFKKGKKCSYHYHLKKTETFYFNGKFILRFGTSDNLAEAEEKFFKSGDIFHIPVGLRHQLEAIEDSDVFEFSTQDYVEDSIRVVFGD